MTFVRFLIIQKLLRLLLLLRSFILQRTTIQPLCLTVRPECNIFLLGHMDTPQEVVETVQNASQYNTRLIPFV